MTKTFENYEDLLKFDSELAKELLEEVGTGDWQKEEIYYCKNIEDFAEHEVTDGWYSSLNLGSSGENAPNLLDYIDYERLGRDLTYNWDNSANYKANSGEILTNSYGW